MVLADLIRRNARRFPSDIALDFKDNKFTWRQFHERTSSLANALIELGASKGDRICVILDNCHQHVEVAGAAWKGGFVAVPLSTHLKQELNPIMGNAQPSVVVVGDNHVDKIRPDWPSIKNVICVGQKTKGMHNYEDLIAKYPSKDPNVDICEDDGSMIYYTSGTTGLPKGVYYSHGGQIKQSEDLLLGGLAWYVQGAAVAIVHPLYFNAPMNLSIILNMMMANPIVILESFSPQCLLETIQKKKIGYFGAVPTMIFRLLQYPDLRNYDFSSLRTIGYGSAPMPVSVLREAIKVFGNIFFQGYGQTECTGGCAVLPIEDHVTDGPERLTRRLASCGLELPNCWIKVMHEDGTEIKRDLNDMGEIILKSEHLMKGYFNMPEETAKVMKDGWLYTGDIASLDEDGYIYIRDRKADLVISGGINIYPREIEEVLFAHPAVVEVAIVGKPDEEWGEIVKAYIVLRPGAKATTKEIIDYTKNRLADYKKPREVEFVESLPHGPTGKVLKRELKGG